MNSRGLKVLYVNPQDCFNIVSGGGQRSYLLLEALTQMDSIQEIDVLYCGNEPFKGTTLQKIGQVFQGRYFYQNFIHKSVNGFFRSLGLDHLSFPGSNIRKKYEEILSQKQYDLVVFRYIATVHRCGWPDTEVIIDVDDLPSEVCTSFIQTSRSCLRKMFLRLSRNYLRRYEKNYMTRARNCFFSNRSHLELYEKSGVNGIYLPNIPFVIPDSSTGKKTEKSGKTLLFVGYLKWKPNVRGIMAFIKDVWPIVHKEIGDVKLRIVGKGLYRKYTDQLKGIAGIEVAGFVENLQEEYENADVVIVPISQGSGTNIKILEALAFSKPVVATSYALRGYENILVPGKDLLVADNPQDYAENIIRILSCPEHGNTLGAAGCQVVADKFSEKYFVSQVRKAIG